MAKIRKVDPKDQGYRQAMKSPKLRRQMQAMLNSIADAAGPGHEVELKEGRTRLRGTVTTRTMAARRAESKNKTLTKAVSAGRRR